MGDVHNQGLYPLEFNNTNAQVSASGCLGSCYSFTATTGTGINAIISSNDFLTRFIDNHSFSLCAWFKTTDASLTPIINITYGIYLQGGPNARFILYNSSRTIYCGGTKVTNDGKWHHAVGTYDVETGKMRIYVDGVLDNEAQYTAGYQYVHSWNNPFYIGRNPNDSTANSRYFFQGSIQDVRFYDHCLSTKEVKEISKGLAIHYKLENHMIKNIMSTPTFNTSAAAGGWSHWGGSGHIGSYAQNTDRNYIYGDQPYSHKVSNGSAATYNYLVYQSPAYDTTISSAGSRSLVAIIKAEGGIPVNNGICYPVCNSSVSASGSPSGYWTDISYLGDGFYECRWDGFYQKGDNNLVGIYVRSGQTIYISSCYVENYSTRAGNTLGPDTDVMEDSSGYGRHGVHYSGTVVGIKIKEGRYDSALENLNGYMGMAEVNMSSLDNITFSWWANYKEFGAQISGLFCTSNLASNPTDYNTTACNMRDNSFDMCNVAGTDKRLSATGIELNKWHHYCVTYDGANERFYVDGVQTASVAQTGALKDFKYLYISYSKAGGVTRMCKGLVADFRIYCTALSAEDVLELYHTPASIDNKGNMHCYELKEV